MRAWLAGVSVVVVGVTGPSVAWAAAPAVQRPGGEPASVEPASVEPASVEPASVEPASVEPASVEPAAVEAESVEAESVAPASADPAPGEADSGEAGSTEADSGGLPGAFDDPQTPPPAEAAQDQSSLPAYDDSIPTYSEAPPALELPPTRPPDGRGRIAVGSVLLGGGAVLVGVSGTMIALDTDLGAWIPGAVIGSAALVAGMGTMLAGHVRRKQYREWATDYGGVRAIPPSGAGMLASGVTCLAAGGFGLLMGSVSFTLQDDDDPPYGQVMVPLALTAMATGAGLLAGGVARQKKFRRWEGSVTPTLSVLPGVDRRLGGVSLGVAAQF